MMDNLPRYLTLLGVPFLFHPSVRPVAASIAVHGARDGQPNVTAIDGTFARTGQIMGG